ncbi:MAG TPA: shikimate kinase [Candidatus Dormibacteraeota bacterium]|nr:shikimate kinase [Candidatus Dormibacteraeota bacterium]
MPVPVPRKVIALVGFMGCGKTTVGHMLAERLGWRFMDLDTRIVERTGSSIVDIFRRHGEPGFREIEAEVLDRVLGETAERGFSAVFALGGGTLTRPENLGRLRQFGATLVWLDCPIDDLLKRCAGVTDRPLFRDETSFRRLFEERLPLYSQADYRVDATSEPAQVVERILTLARLTAVEA